MYGIMTILKEKLLKPVKTYRTHFNKTCGDFKFHIFVVDVFDIDSALCLPFVPFVKVTGFRLTRHLIKFEDANCAGYFKLLYNDGVVSFTLYFLCLEKLLKFFSLYQNDYNIPFALAEVYSPDEHLILTYHDCLCELYSRPSREPSDVCEVFADSEQRGLLEDELPF